MADYETQVSGAKPWADGSVGEGDTKTIIVQYFGANGSTAGSTGGAICNQDYPKTANGVMTVDGHLIIDMAYAVSTVYFGYGSGTVGNYTTPCINAGGQVDINGYGSYNGNNFVNFYNTTTNNGTLNVSNITMYTGDANSTITGTGTFNMTGVRLSGDNGNFNACTVGKIGGGQTINMTGSDLSVYTSLTDVTINMNGGGNYLALRPTITARNVSITGFGQGDIIDIAYLNGDDTWHYDPATGDLVVTSGAYSFTVNIGLGYDPDLFASTNTAYPGMKGVTYLATAPCFLAGTLIEAETGLVAVETLRAGQRLRCIRDGKTSFQRIKAVKRGTVSVLKASNLGLDEAGCSVRICKNAFGDGQPFQDLLVTSEHRFLLDGKLVAIRTMVNGASIRYETDLEHYAYYHIEMERHEIILANGVRTESYADVAAKKDTSGRSAILRTPELVAPLETRAAFLEPLHDRLSRRAESLGIERRERVAAPVAPGVSSHASLSLITADGTIIEPRSCAGAHYAFTIPEGTRSVRLSTLVARPCDVIGPFYDDRRYLGVQIGEVVLFGGRHEYRLDAHLRTDELSGWHGLEGGERRWTKANALIDLPYGAGSGPSVLVVEVAATLEPRIAVSQETVAEAA